MPAPRSPELNHFQRVAKAQTDFYQDRPAILEFNRKGGNDLQLLTDEVQELQDPPEYGLSPAEYRSQELSDVWLFARNMLNRYDSEVDEEYVFRRCLQLIGLVSPAKEKEIDQAESVYQEILARLNTVVEDLTKCCSEGKKSPQLLEGLQEVIAHTTALFHLIGKDPAQACMDKIARNMLKYESSSLGKGVAYEVAAPQIKEEWRRRRGDETFFASEESLPSWRGAGALKRLPATSARKELMAIIRDQFTFVPHALLRSLRQLELFVTYKENDTGWKDLPRGVKFATVRVAKGIGNKLR